MTDLELALAAARSGAAVVRAWAGNTGAAEMKGDVDPVTQADRESEAVILGMLRRHRSDDAVLAEESGASDQRGERIWVVDPLDGTVNFVHGIPHVAVSVGLWEGGRPRAAAIVDVFRGEEFTATEGEGARLDDTPIRVSGTASLDEALIATGFPYDRRSHAGAYAAALAAVLARVQGIRRMGTACLDLAWVAAGRYDGFWEFGLAPWDVAAGMLLVREAGGRVTHHSGRPADLGDRSIVAANGLLQEELRRVVSEHAPAHLDPPAP